MRKLFKIVLLITIISVVCYLIFIQFFSKESQLNGKYLSCQSDSDCIEVPTSDCNDCGCPISINRDFKKDYLSDKANICQNNKQEFSCTMDCPSINVKCDYGKCRAIESAE